MDHPEDGGSERGDRVVSTENLGAIPSVHDLRCALEFTLPIPRHHPLIAGGGGVTVLSRSQNDAVYVGMYIRISWKVKMSAPLHADCPPVRFPWPPFLILVTVVSGVMLDSITGGVMKEFFTTTLLRTMGGVLIGGALALEVWSLRTLKNKKTTIWPHRSSSSLAVNGPYRFSRNPIYIAHVTFTLGIGLLVASPFIVLLTPLLAFGDQKLAIEPEERHLLAKFGEDFRTYLLQTPRWLFRLN
jgi:protein-S-isoprenylcysteine O-methyltransferase Ste14